MPLFFWEWLHEASRIAYNLLFVGFGDDDAAASFAPPADADALAVLCPLLAAADGPLLAAADALPAAFTELELGSCTDCEAANADALALRCANNCAKF